jgi:hypothetical protein
VEVREKELDDVMRPVLKSHATRKNGTAACLAVALFAWKQHTRPIRDLLGEWVVHREKHIIAGLPGS